MVGKAGSNWVVCLCLVLLVDPMVCGRKARTNWVVVCNFLVLLLDVLFVVGKLQLTKSSFILYKSFFL